VNGVVRGGVNVDAPDLDYVPDSFVGPLDRREIAAFEAWLLRSGYDRIRFAPDFVEYLSRFHGGIPRKRYFDNIEVFWSNVSDRIRSFLMPFGELFAGDLLCFDHEGGNPPKVVVWFHEIPVHTEPVADSFAEFLEMLHG